jgi:DNA mismatch repair protein MutS2
MVNSQSRMDKKTLQTLEFGKVLDRLSRYAAFSASSDLALNLMPVNELDIARWKLALTTEARRLLSLHVDFSVRGCHDVRAFAARAAQHGILEPEEFLNIRSTLIRGRELYRFLQEKADDFPLMAEIGSGLQPPSGVIEAISRVISDHGEVLDKASAKLAAIRGESKVAHERLISKLEQIISDPNRSKFLQETLITQRNGRYVIPLRAEFKGRIQAIIHDQSSSGATLFIEPLITVELNNQRQELQLAERDEIRRVLMELTEKVGTEEERVRQIVADLAQIDLSLMMAKYAEDLRATEPELLPMQNGAEGHPGSTLRLKQARYPLLEPDKVVAIDVVLDEKTFGVVITGPNTGGKTVCLKTTGLLVLMAQSGMHIPVQSGSSLSIFADVFADIGDEQSIEQSLSTFSGHITNIIRILKKAGSDALVLLDELGSGTDPQEGSALARALLSYLVKERITFLIATHYPELKIYAYNTPGLTNASMEFDLRTLKPTYHLMIGLPGRSNALAIADRLGLPEEIIAEARQMIDPDELKADDLLNDIHRQRSISRKERRKAEISRSEARRKERELNQRLEGIEAERHEILEKAHMEAQTETERILNEIYDLRKELARARQPLEEVRRVEEKAKELKQDVIPIIFPSVTNATVDEEPIQVGEKVYIRSLGMPALISAISADGFEVQAGNLRIRADREDILRQHEKPVETDRVEKPRQRSRVRRAMESQESGKQVTSVLHPSPGMELDLRGQLAEEALEAVERFIEKAYLATMPFVRIIHGKGTGKLRQVVREALTNHPFIVRWESGVEREGGEGVTIAFLKND